MPFPIFLPLLIKGAIVTAKFVAAKGATATVVKGTAIAVKTYGTAATVGAGATGLSLVGLAVWSGERLKLAVDFVDDAKCGKYLDASYKLVKLIKSPEMPTTGDFYETAHTWISRGCSVSDPAFDELVGFVQKNLDATRETINV